MDQYPLGSLGASGVVRVAFAVGRRRFGELLALTAPPAIVLGLVAVVVRLVAPTPPAMVPGQTPDLSGLGPMLGTALASNVLAGAGMLIALSRGAPAVLRMLLRDAPRVAEAPQPRSPSVGAAVVVAFAMATAATLGLALCLVPGVIIWTMWSAAPIAAGVEGTSAGESFRRSNGLTQGNLGKAFGSLFLLHLAVQVPLTILTAVLAALAGEVAGGLIGVLVTVLGGPFLAAGYTALYLDLRGAREGISPAALCWSQGRDWRVLEGRGLEGWTPVVQGWQPPPPPPPGSTTPWPPPAERPTDPVVAAPPPPPDDWSQPG